MKPNYAQLPFSRLPLPLRQWFEETVQRLEANEDLPLWRSVLPPGSSAADVMIASKCLMTLFPDRMERERNTPVDVEFVL